MNSDEASWQRGPWASLGPDAVLDGRYRLIRLLGRGGMADVWAATDGVLDRSVAVKIFRFDTPGVDQVRIETEMRTLAQLSHPGIINIYDAGTVADPSGIEGARMPYLVMELVEGQTLADRLTHGPLSATEATGLGAQLADTLAYLHRQGVVHRDVKPANILLHAVETPTPTAVRARLTDFGIARLVDSTRITEIDTTVGTANYLSPEQATGAEVGPPSDIYSLGLVLLEALTGELAYPGSGVPAAAARLHHPPHVPDTLDRQWATLLTAMTATDPADRPAANDVAAELTHPGTPVAAEVTRVMSGSTTVQSSRTRQLPAVAGGASARSQRRSHRRWSKPAMWAALVAVALVVVVLVVLATERSRSPAPPTTSPAKYPAVSGQIGQHLRELEDAIG